MTQILKTLDKASAFLNFDDIPAKQGLPAADGKAKLFYEDPSLAEDEQRMSEALEEKRKV